MHDRDEPEQGTQIRRGPGRALSGGRRSNLRWVLPVVLATVAALVLAVNVVLSDRSDDAASDRVAARQARDLAGADSGGVLLGAGLASLDVDLVSRSRPARTVVRTARKVARVKARKRAEARAAARKQAQVERTTEVWQQPESAYRANLDNPLAGRRWGVYDGPQDQVSQAYARASATQRAALDTIVKRPRTKWYGAYVPDGQIRSTVAEYIRVSQNGDPSKLVQFAAFRMDPWEHEACGRGPSGGELASYRHWIDEMAAGIGSAHALVLMQPDMPFLLCSPGRGAMGEALTYATRTLSELPNTSVYLDAGAADWCQNDAGANPETCATLLKETGVRYARGFAMDSTHYTGPVDNIRHGSRIVEILARDGYGRKHFIIDTAKSGRPTHWSDMTASQAGGIKDDAQVCRSSSQTRCVTLGIPPTTKVAEEQFGFSAADRKLARRNVDGFVWFGRPWLYKQADPFVMDRALAMVGSTPWGRL